MTERFRRKPNAKCVVCQKEIYRRPIQLKRSEGRAYCSSVCFGIISRKLIPCANCQKPILSGLNKKTCSRACANEQRTGIKYTRDSFKDKVRHYKSLKLRLLKLRGKKCERCDYNRYEILQVHHIDRNRLNNELNNLELICPNCHFEEHHLKDSWLNSE